MSITVMVYSLTGNIDGRPVITGHHEVMNRMDVEAKVIALTTAAAALMIAGLTWMLLVTVPTVKPNHTPISLETRGGADPAEGIPLNREGPGSINTEGFKNDYPSTGNRGADHGATMSFPESPARAREFSTRDFAGADLNSDGYLTPNEWKRAGQAAFLFEQIDANHDGRIDMQEVARALKTNPYLGNRAE